MILSCSRLDSTHRERKEQYIKALELELARLREVFVAERAQIENHLRNSEAHLREQQQENILLRDILNNRGISFEIQLQQQKNAIAMGAGPQSLRALSPSYSTTQPSIYSSVVAPAPPSQSGISNMHHSAYTNGGGSMMSGNSPQSHNNSSPGATHHSNSPPEIQEIGVLKDAGTPDMPGIFERDPQLGIDFILA